MQELNLIKKETEDIRFKVVIFFVFSIFIASAIRIADFINVSAIISMIMLIIFLSDGLLKNKFVFLRYPLQKPLFLLFFWAIFSLLITKIYSAKVIPDEAYNYVWARGLSSPYLRGISFLARLFLSIFTINFIIENVDTEKKYFKVLNYYLLFYSLLCFYMLAQIVLYVVFQISIGHLRPSAIEDSFRIGGHVGESSVLGSLIVSGYFVLIAISIKRYDAIWFSKFFLRVLLIISTVTLISTHSAAWIIALLISLFIVGSRHLNNRRNLIIIVGAVALGFIFYIPFLQQAVFLRAIGEVSSYNVRTYSWIAGLCIFLDNIITGIGIGQSVFFMPVYLAKIENKYTDPEEFSTLFLASRFPPMNNYIQWMAETGIVGLLLLFYIIYVVYKYNKKVSKLKFQYIVKFGFGGGLMATLIAINAEPDVIYTGFFSFLTSMYVSGNRIFGESEQYT